MKLGDFTTVPAPLDARHAEGDARRRQRRRSIGVKYKWQALTLFGGYEYARLSSPSDFRRVLHDRRQRLTRYTLNGGYPGIIQKNAFVNPEDLQVRGSARSTRLLSNLDAAAGYYYEWQNNYTLLRRHAAQERQRDDGGLRPEHLDVGPACGATPQGANHSTCAGHTDAVSAMLDWRPVKRVDIYGGVMFSQVAGGMANGFITDRQHRLHQRRARQLLIDAFTAFETTDPGPRARGFSLAVARCSRVRRARRRLPFAEARPKRNEPSASARV